MAAGKRPFEGKSQLSLATAILERDPEPIRTLKPLTPPALEHVVSSCLAKNQDDRFQTAHNVRLELEWIAKELPQLAAPSPRAPGKTFLVSPSFERANTGPRVHCERIRLAPSPLTWTRIPA